MNAQSDVLLQWLAPAFWSFPPKAMLILLTLFVAIFCSKDAVHWAEIIYSYSLVYSPASQDILKETTQGYFSIASEFIKKMFLNYNHCLSILKTQLGLKGKHLFLPLRIALTNEVHVLKWVKIVSLMGLDEFYLD